MEAARSVVDYGFSTAKLARIVAIARPENKASRNVMHKLGMTFVRETDTGELGKQPPAVKLVYYTLENSAAHTESL
jgi:RimJ/RimL family protein N-acetyltransferase